MAAYFKKKQSPAYKGNFENLGAVFGLFAATASRQQARDVYNLGAPLPPPLEAFHLRRLLLLLLLLIELQDPVPDSAPPPARCQLLEPSC